MVERGKGSEKSHKVNIPLYKPQKPGINTTPTISLLLSTSVLLSHLQIKQTLPTFSRPSSLRLMISKSKSVRKPLVLLKTMRPVNPSHWACAREKK